MNDIIEQVVAMEGKYQAGELFTGDISQIMGIEEEVNDVSTNDRNTLNKGLRPSIIAINAVKPDIFKRIALEMVMKKNTEPPHEIIGTVTHTMEAQTPVTDKSL